MHPMERQPKDWKFWTVNASRLVLAVVFLFSGYVKGADPTGMAYKVGAYFQHWHLPFTDASLVVQGCVVLLAAVEFVIGLYLLLGIRRRLTSLAVFLFMTGMTALTVYIYLYNPVADCGCFGDAVKLTNGQTLAKNLVLWPMALLVLRCNGSMARFISERNQWLASIYAWVYIFILALHSFHYLPAVDFTAYKVGTDLREAMQAEVETELIYERRGERRTFTVDSLPGDEWTFVDSRTTVVKPAAVTDFFLLDDEGADLAPGMQEYTSYAFLLTIPDAATADDGCNDRINDLYDFALDNGYAFYGAAAATPAEIEEWRDKTGASYVILKADRDMLRSAVRSNPGMLLLHDGKIVAKWSNNNLPEGLESWQPARGEREQMQAGGLPLYVRQLLWFLVPLLVVMCADSLWVASKYYKRYRHKKLLKQKQMRKKIVAGNWKMNKNLQEGLALAGELVETLKGETPKCDVIICTPFIHLAPVAGLIKDSVIALGAENCADKASGAYTGEVSAEMVKSTGAEYVILGHSERRAYYHETPEILKEKINLALANGLKVIFCIGEVLEERESGKQNEVVKAQLEGSLFELTKEQFANIVLAYEPVWAIGTGKTATAEQAEEMHAFIRSVIAEKFGAEAAENVSILYGGSCKPGNAKEIFAKGDVDGGLIGGAALKAADFKGIIDAWN